MWHFLKESGSAFMGGFAGGCVVFGGVLFGTRVDFVGEYLVKLIFTAIGGLLSGFCVAYGKHIFEKRKKKVKTDGKEDNKANAA